MPGSVEVAPRQVREGSICKTKVGERSGVRELQMEIL